MNRRSFFRFLGLGALVAPALARKALARPATTYIKPEWARTLELHVQTYEEKEFGTIRTWVVDEQDFVQASQVEDPENFDIECYQGEFHEVKIESLSRSSPEEIRAFDNSFLYMAEPEDTPFLRMYEKKR